MDLTFDQSVLFGLIVIIFGFLLWGKFRYDLVAFSALVVAYLLGVVPKEEVFAGFGHPAVVIIALISGMINLLSLGQHWEMCHVPETTDWRQRADGTIHGWFYLDMRHLG